MRELLERMKLKVLPDDLKKKITADTAALKASKKKIIAALTDLNDDEKESYFSSIVKPKGDLAHQRRHAVLTWLKEDLSNESGDA